MELSQKLRKHFFIDFQDIKISYKLGPDTGIQMKYGARYMRWNNIFYDFLGSLSLKQGCFQSEYLLTCLRLTESQLKWILMLLFYDVLDSLACLFSNLSIIKIHLILTEIGTEFILHQIDSLADLLLDGWSKSSLFLDQCCCQLGKMIPECFRSK